MSACHDMRSWNLEDGSRTPLIVISPPSPRQSSTLQPTANSTWLPRPGESPSLTLSVAKSTSHGRFLSLGSHWAPQRGCQAPFVAAHIGLLRTSHSALSSHQRRELL